MEVVCRLPADHPDLSAVLALIKTEFAYMDGRIDPPSSMHRLSLATLQKHAAEHEIWVIGTPPVACVFLTAKPEGLYVGKLAVASAYRKQGYAKALVDLAKTRTKALGKAFLELETRVELVENQATFERLGFVRTAETAHAGYDRPTSFTYRLSVM
jgi:ribosomal protein S18 acetylase RimI-like enzyme